MQSIVKNKRILIIRLSSYGDVLLTSPVIRALKKTYPYAIIDFLVRKPFHQMIENNPDINLFFYDKSDDSDIKKLSRNDYNIVLDLQDNGKSISTLRKLTFDLKVVYNKERFSRFFYIYFKAKSFNNPLKTVPERYLETLKSFEIEKDGLLPDYTISKSYSFDGIDEKLDHYICIAPGAAHFTKQWSKEYYSELIDKIEATYKVVLLGGKADSEIAAFLCKKNTKLINFVGKTSFDESAYLMKYSKAVICNDSSIMHLATALKKKTLVFFGSTTKQFGFLLNHNNLVLMENNDISCRPCSHMGKKSCPKGHFNCMKSLKVDKAFEKFEQLLETN